MRDFKNTGKKIAKNFLFIIILFVILAGVSNKIENALLENDNLVQSRNKSTYRILREKEDSIDVIVVGDSLSYSSISPMQLWKKCGITSYVCGQSGQEIQETYHMLETAFATQSPRLIILETNALFRGQPGIAGWKESIEEFGNHYIPILRGHDVWKSWIVNKQYPEENYKGFAFRCEVQPYKKGNYMFETEQKEEMPDVVLSYMKSILDLCRKNGAELLLLGTPSPRNYTYQRHNSISLYAKEHALDFLDLNLKLEEVEIDWKTDSLDNGDHLNLSGAEKVTDYLGEYLKANYELSDHRNEESYGSWEKESEGYEEKAAEYLKVIRKDDKETE